MKTSKLITILSVLLLALLLSSETEAKLVQILHTNDTHSYLDNSTHNTLQGGAARLKTMIDTYKKKMADEGTETLVLDAGDFLEGNLYYMAKNGRKSFEVHNEIGYDAGTLGNHDYLMGSAELDKILGELDLKFSLVVANLEADKKYKNIS
jgi:2',3'-cyclic-nucleotide 2'-phosphodiesterase (5'-nucleotidase family)